MPNSVYTKTRFTPQLHTAVAARITRDIAEHASRLRAIVSLDDDQIGARHWFANFKRGLVFRRMPVYTDCFSPI